MRLKFKQRVLHLWKKCRQRWITIFIFVGLITSLIQTQVFLTKVFENVATYSSSGIDVSDDKTNENDRVRKCRENLSYPLEGNISEYVHQLRARIKPKVSPINSYNFTFLLHNPNLCLTKNGELDNITLIILIKSAVSHKARRLAIRTTWGQKKLYSNFKVRLAFLLGFSPPYKKKKQRSIVHEHVYYADMIQSNFSDSYFNNTIQTMQGFRWVMENYAHSEYIFFSDDDMFVSVENLLNRVKFNLSENMTDILYMGNIGGNIPHRKMDSKWYLTLEEYPYCNFPRIINAGAFVLSNEALKLIFYGSRFTKHFRFDDVFLGLIAYKMNITLTHSDNFFVDYLIWGDPKFKTIIAVHDYTPYDIKAVWKKYVSRSQY